MLVLIATALAQAAAFTPPALPARWGLEPSAVAARPLLPTPAQADLPRGMYGYTAALATGRVALGVAPIVAPARSAALLGFPEAHDNATSRLMARLFGVRDIGLGALTMASAHDTTTLRRAYLFNAAIDIADTSMIAIPLIADDGIDEAAWRSVGFALGGCSLWLIGAWWTTR